MVPHQMVELKWSPSIKRYYIEHGYEYTKMGDAFLVDIDDLNTNSSASVTAVCDECGADMKIQYRNHVKHDDEKDYCKNCLAFYSSIPHNMSRSEFIHQKFDKAKKICDDFGYVLLTDETEYTGARMRIKYICGKHGEQSMSFDNFLAGRRCPICKAETNRSRSLNDPDYVESCINQYNGNILLNKDEYVNAKTTNLRILCGECGENEFVTSFSNYMSINVHRCRHCSYKVSEPEKYISEYLTSKNISFVTEKRFSGCKDKYTLPFDFYLIDYNAIIEFDGRHHYFPDIFGEAHLRIAREHDKIKNKFCEDNNIRLLRIPYYCKDVNGLIDSFIEDIA